MNSKQLLQAKGLSIKEPVGAYDFSALQGKKCYGQLLENPQFTTSAQFEDTIKDTPQVQRIRPEVAGIDFKDREWLTVEGEYIHTVSKKYNVMQHSEMLGHVQDAIRQIGLDPVGSIRHDGGRMTGHVLFIGAEEQIELLKDTGEDIAIGAKFGNSYDGTKGISVESFGIRTICINYNAWGNDIARTYTTHANRDFSAEIEKGFRQMIEATYKLPAIINRAKEVIVNFEDIPALLYGGGIPDSYVEQRQGLNIMDNLRTYEPSITKEDPTLWQVYNAGTACLTHAAQLRPEAVEANLGKWAGILSGNLDAIIEDGNRTREARKANLKYAKA